MQYPDPPSTRPVHRLRRRRWAQALAILAAAALGACGGGSKPAATGGGDIDASLGIDKAGMALMQTKVEELVQGCMKRAGFEYISVDPAISTNSMVRSPSMINLTI